LRNSVNDWFSKVERGSDIDNVIVELKKTILGWQIKENKEVFDNVSDLFNKGVQAGIKQTGIPVDEQIYSDLSWQTYRQTGIAPAVNRFADDVFKDLSQIVRKHYELKKEIPLYRTQRDVNSYLRDARYKTERIVKTETAKHANMGVLKAWEEDPEKEFYQYYWENPEDGRSKRISLIRKEGNPYSFMEISFLWKNQEQMIKGKFENDSYNQRCSLSRGDRLEKEFTDNRFENRKEEFRKTI